MTIILALLMSMPGWAADIGPYQKETSETDGRLIAEKVKDFNTPKKDLVIYAVMTLKSGDVVSDTRKVIIKQKTYGELSRYVFRFIDSLKRGLTFLTIETKGTSDDQYLYIPAIGRPRQVASLDRQSKFEDTDLTNEDMGGIKLDDYTYRRGSDAELEGKSCFKITVYAKDAEATYPRRIIWVDKETYVPLQTKVYDRDNKLDLIGVAGNIQNVGGIHVPFKSVVKSLKNNHMTILEVSRADVDTGIDELPFNKDTMGEPWKENF